MKRKSRKYFLRGQGKPTVGATPKKKKPIVSYSSYGAFATFAFPLRNPR